MKLFDITQNCARFQFHRNCHEDLRLVYLAKIWSLIYKQRDKKAKQIKSFQIATSIKGSL